MKQYVMICGEEVMKRFGDVFKGIEFLEVQGMNMNGENRATILVTPVMTEPTITSSEEVDKHDG